MSAWHEGVIAALDLETTGVDPLDARIVQASLVFVEPDGTLGTESWTGLVDPGVDIPVGASNVHGITTEMAREHGIRLAEALGHLLDRLDRVVERTLPLVIYNAPYDWPLLLAEARRNDLTVPRALIIDPLICDRAMDRFRPGSRRLEDVAGHYGYVLDDAHDAEADAVASVAIARAVAASFSDVGEHSPAELQQLQAEWYADWARGLSEFRGEPIDQGWPLPESASV